MSDRDRNHRNDQDSNSKESERIPSESQPDNETRSLDELPELDNFEELDPNEEERSTASSPDRSNNTFSPSSNLAEDRLETEQTREQPTIENGHTNGNKSRQQGVSVEDPIADNANVEEGLPPKDEIIDTDEDSSGKKDIADIESGQEYIQITPVRSEVNSDTVCRELYGLHRYGSGRKLPLDMELHVDSIESVSTFEFIIYKPKNKAKLKFFIGPGDRGEVECDRLESTTRSQYPEDFDFDRTQFDIQEVFNETPHMVRFDGLEERRKDWMMKITDFDNETTKRSPLSNLLETIVQANGSVIFQGIFEPRSDWSAKAERQKGILKRGCHTQGGFFVRSFLDALLGVDDAEKRERISGESEEEIGGSIHDSQTEGPRSGTSRMGQIDLKNPSHTYNLTLRVAAEEKRIAENVQDSLNQLSGKFYTIDGNYLGKQEHEFRRMLEHGITYPNGYEMVTRRKPILVCNIEELSNFITVPSIDALPKASRGGSGGRPAAQAPLTSPNEEVFTEFTGGMSIGHAVTALRDKEIEYDDFEDTRIESKRAWLEDRRRRDTISLSADHLTHHYIRAGTTGSGKSVSTVNDILSAHIDLKGPTILIDPKDGDMCPNYIRSHKAVVGNLDDVEYLKIPEKDGKIPGMPFFDLRPLVTGAGRERTTAIQDIIDHYFELLRFVLGKETVEQAFVANEILTNLIKALFDKEHGSDYFAVGDLLEAAQRFQHHGKSITDAEHEREQVAKAMPPVSDQDVREILESHLEKEERQFMNTTDAVLNRIRKLKERDFIWDMLSFKVEEEFWNEDTGWYDRSEVPMLDLKNILNSNRVLLIDTGELRGESSELFTVLFLSHLWTSVQSLWTPNEEEYIANVIIEESANIARNEIVYSELLPKGREFNLSLGLIMQYPEQVLGDNPRQNRRAYKEILNNVNTKIIANIATDDDLAESLFHEDLEAEEIKDRIAGLRQGEWVVQLPSTGFNQQKPEILTLKPLPIPPGHNAGPFEVSSNKKAIRKRSRDLHCVSKRTQETEDGADHEFIGRVFEYEDGRRYRRAEGATNDDNEEVGAEDPYDSDEEIEVDEDEINLGFEERGFIDFCVKMMTNGVDDRTLGQSMTNHMYSDKASTLIENGFLKKVTLAQNKVYYYPTEKGQIAVDADLSPDEKGELGGESPMHRIGVRMIATYYEQRGYDVEMYATPQGTSDKLDVIARPTDESEDDNRKLVEVETSPEKKGHVEDDFQTLASHQGDSIWVVQNLDNAEKLFSCLAGYIDKPDMNSDNFEVISDQLDYAGLTEVFGINQLRRELE